MDVSASTIPREGTIPRTFTADGADISPALSWTGVPPGTKELAVIMDDPDAPAGLWTHWTLYGLPATVSALEENLPKMATLPSGAHQGRNTWGRLGYNGPAPPPGRPHRYIFKVLALSERLGLPPGITREALNRALKGRILDEGSLVARYGR